MTLRYMIGRMGEVTETVPPPAQLLLQKIANQNMRTEQGEEPIAVTRTTMVTKALLVSGEEAHQRQKINPKSRTANQNTRSHKRGGAISQTRTNQTGRR